MELGVLGQDNGKYNEYSLNWGSYYFECLKLNEDVPVKNGELGRIVITDLFNYRLPMIRYDTGDLGIIESINGKTPVLKEIVGRKRDVVYTTKGEMLTPATVTVNMWGIKNINQWQFIQKENNLYLLKVNKSGNISENELISKMKNILGQDANIIIEYVNEIPVLKSNKRKTVVCEIENKNTISEKK